MMRKVIFTGVIFAVLLVSCFSAVKAEENPGAVQSDSAKEIKVKKYTPIIWLANDEILYPMIPHPFAFDGIDNDLDGKVDLEDADEVGMDNLKPEDFLEELYGMRQMEIETEHELDSVSESALIECLTYVDEHRAEEHIMTVMLAESIERLLEEESGEDVLPGTAWKEMEEKLNKPFTDRGISPTDLSKAWRAGYNRWYVSVEKENLEVFYSITVYSCSEDDTQKDDCPKMVIRREMLPPPRVIYYHDPKQRVRRKHVYQYWLYYILDMGFEGHKHDSEHVFVFVNKEGNVTGFVGAGHTSATANNILVAGDPYSAREIFPECLPRHMPVLVELGKHASAPDRNMDGRFDPGMDADVFVHYTWGSRDIMTTTGAIVIGEFKQEHSYPRSRSNIMIEESLYQKLKEEPIPGYEERDPCKKVDANILAQLREYNIQRTYSLFPLEYMQELHRLLKEAKSGKKTKEEVEEWLEGYKSIFWGDRAPQSVKISMEPGNNAFEGMKKWLGKEYSNAKVWEHEDHKDPENIFKLWLFPSWALDLVVKGEYSEKFHFVPGFGLRYSDPLSSTFGRGAFEIRGDYDIVDEEADIALYLDWPFGINYHLYGGIGWGNLSFEKPRFTSRNCLTLYTGAKLSWDLSFLWHTQAELFLGWRGEIRKPGSLENDPSTLQFGLSFARGFYGPKHPLDYWKPR